MWEGFTAFFLDPTPQQTLLALEFVVLVPPLALALWWHIRRRKTAEAALHHTEARTEALEQALGLAPDGWYAWFDGTAARDDETPATASNLLDGGLCSRRLAVLLGLYTGQAASLEEVLQDFAPDDITALRAQITALREDGDGFEVVATHTANGPDSRRRLRVTGIRAVANDGTPLADLLWMRDVTAEEEAITSLTEESAALARERDSLRATLDAVPLPVWLRDEGLRITFANRTFLDAAEAVDVDHLHREDRELTSGVTAREMRALASAARAADAARQAPFHVVLHGSRRLMDITEVPATVGTGSEPHRVTVGVAQDATPLETLRTTLEREAASHATVLERLGTAIAIYGPDRRLRFYNTAYARLWRLDHDWLDDQPAYGELLEALRARRLLPEVADYPAYKEAELNRFTSLLEPREDLLHLPDGKTLRRVIAPHPLGGLLTTFEDVTDRLALEASRNQMMAVQRETIDHLHEAVAVFGPDGRLRLYNPSFQDLWALDEDTLAGTPHLSEILAVFPPGFKRNGTWDDLHALLGADPQDRTVRRSRMDRGDGLTLDAVGVPLPDGGVLFTFLDMSDTARVERALRERAEALAAADRLKTQFMANVSYELRTPLTTILGFSEILADGYYGDLNPRQRDYARGLAETAQTLVALIDDISDLVSIEAGHLHLERASFDVHAALASVLALTKEALRRKGLTLNFDCPPETGRMVADEKRVKQVLYHLLINAIKYTPDGGQIILAAQREPAADEEGRDLMVFTVADTGVGIPGEDQTDIFDRFSRPGRASTGPGVGLALVRRFAELHGGDVDLVSVPGEGTTVTVRIPTG